jgi:sortase A
VLGDLRRGDEIVVTTGQAESTFLVVSRRDSTQVIPTPTGATASLVLSTASPPLAPDRSLIVTADLKSEVLPGRVDHTAITEAERSLTGDEGAALPVMLWGQALVGLVLATSWAYVRWLRWPTYLITTPILLAVLWNLYESIAKLLPNTM